MRSAWIFMLAGLFLGAPCLAAQEPEDPPRPERRPGLLERHRALNHRFRLHREDRQRNQVAMRLHAGRHRLERLHRLGEARWNRMHERLEMNLERMHDRALRRMDRPDLRLRTRPLRMRPRSMEI